MVKAHKDEDISVARKEYTGGYTLFCFDKTPDFGECDHFSLIKTGSERLGIIFGAPLAQITMLNFKTFWKWAEIATFSTIILPKMFNSVNIDRIL